MRFWIYLACCLLVTGALSEKRNENASKKSKVEDIPELIAVASDEKEDDSDTEEEPKRLVCYLNFETKPDAKTKKGTIRVITDKSGYDNNGDFSVGGEILKYAEKDFTCNQAARLWESDILFKGDLFQAKPRKAMTVAAWIKLEEKPGQHSIFDTIGRSHAQGQFHFEVNDGVLRWFHRNECQNTVFETMAHTVPKDKWTHVAGTYDSKTKQAKVFINGNLRNMSIGEGELSRDWAARAGIGNHMKHRPLRGSIDEFRIYNYALKSDEIKALVGACRNGDGEQRSETAEPEQTGDVKKEERRRRSLAKDEKSRSKASKRNCVQKRSVFLEFARTV
ncbi:uncharacterized protein LOC130655325 isoform X3 [Hydractinia symbiolongicarpus]|uniref:uncharacterized protein LOC130655325 isoform X3 n=1 Tax=Hydractinia symbiolongicarpus TaxID=13093 RepID=UPI00254B9535|nr:uncharacterized protein LOC130655325 isoform X3 [Hydractinia symbiolongicarpus]